MLLVLLRLERTREVDKSPSVTNHICDGVQNLPLAPYQGVNAPLREPPPSIGVTSQGTGGTTRRVDEHRVEARPGERGVSSVGSQYRDGCRAALQRLS